MKLLWQLVLTLVVIAAIVAVMEGVRILVT
jgi:hypothetical protein